VREEMRNAKTRLVALSGDRKGQAHTHGWDGEREKESEGAARAPAGRVAWRARRPFHVGAGVGSPFPFSILSLSRPVLSSPSPQPQDPDLPDPDTQPDLPGLRLFFLTRLPLSKRGRAGRG